MKNKRNKLVILVLEFWTACVLKIVVHFSCLLGGFSLIDWMDYEERLIYLTRFNSIMM